MSSCVELVNTCPGDWQGPKVAGFVLFVRQVCVRAYPGGRRFSSSSPDKCVPLEPKYPADTTVFEPSWCWTSRDQLWTYGVLKFWSIPPTSWTERLTVEVPPGGL